MRIARERPTFGVEVPLAMGRCGRGESAFGWTRPYHPPMRLRIQMARSAAIPNHPMLSRPRGSTHSAASKGPQAPPAFPPTWKSDCAKPCCPPEARRATRDASGWNTAEPMPIRAADARSSGNAGTRENKMSPIRVEPIPTAREYGWGWRSVAKPTSGCRSDAVHWYVKVISPTCAKLSWNAVFSNGYIAGISDCIISLRKWQKPMATRIGKTVRYPPAGDSPAVTSLSFGIKANTMGQKGCEPLPGYLNRSRNTPSLVMRQFHKNSVPKSILQ